MILKHFRRSSTVGYPSYLSIFTLLFLISKFAILTVVGNVDGETCNGYATKIEVVSNKKECLNVHVGNVNVWQSPNLESAFERVNSILQPSICIELNSVYRTVENLTKNYIFRRSKSSIKIISRTPDTAVTVKCKQDDDEGSNASYGVSFIDNDRIELANLNFLNCGGEHKTHYRQNHYTKDSKILHKMNLTAVLNFENVKKVITMRNIRISEFRGYGIVLTDCTGNIQLSDLVLDTNTPVRCNFENMKGIVYLFLNFAIFLFYEN